MMQTAIAGKLLPTPILLISHYRKGIHPLSPSRLDCLLHAGSDRAQAVLAFEPDNSDALDLVTAAERPGTKKSLGISSMDPEGAR